jgi:hypothetical protein
MKSPLRVGTMIDMRYRLAVALVCSLLLAVLPAVAGITATSGSHSLVVTQFYFNANASTSTSPYAVDFIEIFNAGPVAVDLQNWTIQSQGSTSTGGFGGSGIYPIGSLDPYKSGVAYGPNGDGTYPQFQITYSSQAQTNLHCRAALPGEYTQHCFLQPGQYLLVQIAPSSSSGSKGTPFPLTADLDLTGAGPNAGAVAAKSDGTQNNWIGGTGANAGLPWKPSATAQKIALANSPRGIAGCTAGATGNPIPNTTLFGAYSDFIGYNAATYATNCWEGPNSTLQTVFTSPNPSGPALLGGTTGNDNKNKNAVVRMAAFDGTFPPTAAIAPCADSDNNMTNFGRIPIGAAGTGAANWILHNSSQSWDVTGFKDNIGLSPCPSVANSVAPLASGLNAVASPAEVVANTSTPVSLTVTVSDGGVSPTSAVFGVTADLSGVKGLVETTEGTTPQVFGYSAQDTFGNPQYMFPAPASTTTMTVNAPLADVGNTYSIPITVVDDAYRTVTTSISLKVVGSTPGTANLSAVPASVPATVPTPMDLTVALTDPGSHPTGTSFTITMDLTAVGGGNAVSCPEVSTDVYTCHTTVTADISMVNSSLIIPVTVVDDQSRTLTLTPANIQIPVTGRPEPVATLAWAAPSTGNFGSATQGTTSATSQTATLTNTGLVALSVASVGTDNTEFAAMSACPASLDVNASCTITLTFTPSAVGSRTGNLIVTDDSHLQAGAQQVLAISGTGTPPPATAELSPSPLSFGNQLATTSSAAQTVTLKNNGGMPLTINKVDWLGQNIGEFSHATTCLSSLAPGSSCTFTITFSPATAGSKTASLSLTDNASGSPHTVNITGTGTDFPVEPVQSGGDTQTVTAGQTATYNMQVNPSGPFAGTVALTCASVIQAATCTVNPTSVNVAGSAVPFTLSIATTARSITTAQNGWSPITVGGQGGPSSGGHNMPLVAFCIVVLAAGAVVASSRKTRQQWRAAVLCTALLCVMGMTACAGLKTAPWPQQPSVTTPAGAYTVTLKATYGTVFRLTTLTLNVN